MSNWIDATIDKAWGKYNMCAKVLIVDDEHNIVDILNNSLSQLEIEIPHIPTELNPDFVKLTELSTLAVECVIPAAKAYFRNPDSIPEQGRSPPRSLCPY